MQVQRQLLKLFNKIASSISLRQLKNQLMRRKRKKKKERKKKIMEKKWMKITKMEMNSKTK